MRSPGDARFFNLVVCSFSSDGFLGLDCISVIPCFLWLTSCLTIPTIIFRCTVFATQVGFNEWTYETGFDSLLCLVKPEDFTQTSIS